eukprot:UN22481
MGNSKSRKGLKLPTGPPPSVLEKDELHNYNIYRDSEENIDVDISIEVDPNLKREMEQLERDAKIINEKREAKRQAKARRRQEKKRKHQLLLLERERRRR